MNLIISESEKERILGMHRNAIKKEFLFEYNTPDPTPVPIKKSAPIPGPETVDGPEPEISTPVISNSENNTILSKLESQLRNIKSLQSELNTSIDEIKQQQAIENTKTAVAAIVQNIQSTSDQIDKKCQNLRIFGDKANKQRCKVLTADFKALKAKQQELLGLKQEAEQKKGNKTRIQEWIKIALTTLQVISFAKTTFATKTPAIPIDLNLNAGSGGREEEEDSTDVNDL